MFLYLYPYLYLYLKIYVYNICILCIHIIYIYAHIYIHIYIYIYTYIYTYIYISYLFSWLCLLVTLAAESRCFRLLQSHPQVGRAVFSKEKWQPFLMVQLNLYFAYLFQQKKRSRFFESSNHWNDTILDTQGMIYCKSLTDSCYPQCDGHPPRV